MLCWPTFQWAVAGKDLGLYSLGSGEPGRCLRMRRCDLGRKLGKWAGAWGQDREGSPWGRGRGDPSSNSSESLLCARPGARGSGTENRKGPAFTP